MSAVHILIGQAALSGMRVEYKYRKDKKMSYKLEKPYTDMQRADFIVQYNHNMGLNIEETENGIYALLENEYINEAGEAAVDSNYAIEKAQKRQQIFEQEFFQTSLGWIRRKVNMQDGSKKDFLSDLLLQIKAGLELGQNVQIITYSLPDFTQEITEEYMLTLQTRKNATLQFIQECLMQTVADFMGEETE